MNNYDSVTAKIVTGSNTARSNCGCAVTAVRVIDEEQDIDRFLVVVDACGTPAARMSITLDPDAIRTLAVLLDNELDDAVTVPKTFGKSD